MKRNNATIAKELIYWRKENKLSQRELSRKTDLTQQTISRWESGQSTINILDCITLANFYGITIDELIGKDV